MADIRMYTVKINLAFLVLICALLPGNALGADFTRGPVKQMDHDCFVYEDGLIVDSCTIPYSTIGYTRVSTAARIRIGLQTDGSIIADSSDVQWVTETRYKPGPYIDLDAGRLCACGVLASGAVDCWGYECTRALPATGDFIHVAQYIDDRYRPCTCAVSRDGTISCRFDRRGDEFGKCNPPSNADFIQVARGNYHSCAVSRSGRLNCWGNHDGYAAPGQIAGDFTQVAAATEMTCVSTTRESVVCWGSSRNAGLHGGRSISVPVTVLTSLPYDDGYLYAIAPELAFAAAPGDDMALAVVQLAFRPNGSWLELLAPQGSFKYIPSRSIPDRTIMVVFGEDTTCFVRDQATSYELLCSSESRSTFVSRSVGIHPALVSPEMAMPGGRGPLRPVGVISGEGACAVIVPEQHMYKAANNPGYRLPPLGLTKGTQNLTCFGESAAAVQLRQNLPREPLNLAIPLQASAVDCASQTCCAVSATNGSSLHCWSSQSGAPNDAAIGVGIASSLQPKLNISGLCVADTAICTLDSYGAVRCVNHSGYSMPVPALLMPASMSGIPASPGRFLDCSNSHICVVTESGCPVCFPSTSTSSAKVQAHLTAIQDTFSCYDGNSSSAIPHDGMAVSTGLRTTCVLQPPTSYSRFKCVEEDKIAVDPTDLDPGMFIRQPDHQQVEDTFVTDVQRTYFVDPAASTWSAQYNDSCSRDPLNDYVIPQAAIRGLAASDRIHQTIIAELYSNFTLLLYVMPVCQSVQEAAYAFAWDRLNATYHYRPGFRVVVLPAQTTELDDSIHHSSALLRTRPADSRTFSPPENSSRLDLPIKYIELFGLSAWASMVSFYLERQGSMDSAEDFLDAWISNEGRRLNESAGDNDEKLGWAHDLHARAVLQHGLERSSRTQNPNEVEFCGPADNSSARTTYYGSTSTTYTHDYRWKHAFEATDMLWSVESALRLELAVETDVRVVGINFIHVQRDVANAGPGMSGVSPLIVDVSSGASSTLRIMGCTSRLAARLNMSADGSGRTGIQYTNELVGAALLLSSRHCTITSNGRRHCSTAEALKDDGASYLDVVMQNVQVLPACVAASASALKDGAMSSFAILPSSSSIPSRGSPLLRAIGNDTASEDARWGLLVAISKRPAPAVAVFDGASRVRLELSTVLDASSFVDPIQVLALRSVSRVEVLEVVAVSARTGLAVQYSPMHAKIKYEIHKATLSACTRVYGDGCNYSFAGIMLGGTPVPHALALDCAYNYSLAGRSPPLQLSARHDSTPQLSGSLLGLHNPAGSFEAGLATVDVSKVILVDSTGVQRRVSPDQSSIAESVGAAVAVSGARSIGVRRVLVVRAPAALWCAARRRIFSDANSASSMLYDSSAVLSRGVCGDEKGSIVRAYATDSVSMVSIVDVDADARKAIGRQPFLDDVLSLATRLTFSGSITGRALLPPRVLAFYEDDAWVRAASQDALHDGSMFAADASAIWYPIMTAASRATRDLAPLRPKLEVSRAAPSSVTLTDAIVVGSGTQNHASGWTQALQLAATDLAASIVLLHSPTGEDKYASFLAEAALNLGLSGDGSYIETCEQDAILSSTGAFDYLHEDIAAMSSEYPAEHTVETIMYCVTSAFGFRPEAIRAAAISLLQTARSRRTAMHGSGGVASIRMSGRGLGASISGLQAARIAPAVWNGGILALSSAVGHGDVGQASSTVSLNIQSSSIQAATSVLGSGGFLSVQSWALSTHQVEVKLQSSSVYGCVAPAGAGGCIAVARSSSYPWEKDSSTISRPAIDLEVLESSLSHAVSGSVGGAIAVVGVGGTVPTVRLVASTINASHAEAGGGAICLLYLATASYLAAVNYAAAALHLPMGPLARADRIAQPDTLVTLSSAAEALGPDMGFALQAIDSATGLLHAGSLVLNSSQRAVFYPNGWGALPGLISGALTRPVPQSSIAIQGSSIVHSFVGRPPCVRSFRAGAQASCGANSLGCIPWSMSALSNVPPLLNSAYGSLLPWYRSMPLCSEHARSIMVQNDLVASPSARHAKTLGGRLGGAILLASAENAFLNMESYQKQFGSNRSVLHSSVEHAGVGLRDGDYEARPPLPARGGALAAVQLTDPQVSLQWMEHGMLLGSKWADQGGYDRLQYAVHAAQLHSAPTRSSMFSGSTHSTLVREELWQHSTSVGASQDSDEQSEQVAIRNNSSGVQRDEACFAFLNGSWWTDASTETSSGLLGFEFARYAATAASQCTVRDVATGCPADDATVHNASESIPMRIRRQAVYVYVACRFARQLALGASGTRNETIKIRSSTWVADWLEFIGSWERLAAMPESEINPTKPSLTVIVRDGTSIRRSVSAAAPGTKSSSTSGGGSLYIEGAKSYILGGASLAHGSTGGSGGVILARYSSLLLAGASISTGLAWDGVGGCVAHLDAQSTESQVRDGSTISGCVAMRADGGIIQHIAGDGQFGGGCLATVRSSIKVGPHARLDGCRANAMGGAWMHTGEQSRAELIGPVALHDGIVLGDGYNLQAMKQGHLEITTHRADEQSTPQEPLAPLEPRHIVAGGGLLGISSSFSLNSSLCRPVGTCSFSLGKIHGMRSARGGCLMADSLAQLDVAYLGLSDCSIWSTLPTDVYPKPAGYGGAVSVSRMRVSDALYSAATIRSVLVEDGSALGGAAFSLDLRSSGEATLDKAVIKGVAKGVGKAVYFPDPSGVPHQDLNSYGCDDHGTALSGSALLWYRRSCLGAAAVKGICPGCLIDDAFQPQLLGLDRVKSPTVRFWQMASHSDSRYLSSRHSNASAMSQKGSAWRTLRPFASGMRRLETYYVLPSSSSASAVRQAETIYLPGIESQKSLLVASLLDAFSMPLDGDLAQQYGVLCNVYATQELTHGTRQAVLPVNSTRTYTPNTATGTVDVRPYGLLASMGAVVRLYVRCSSSVLGIESDPVEILTRVAGIKAGLSFAVANTSGLTTYLTVLSADASTVGILQRAQEDRDALALSCRTSESESTSYSYKPEIYVKLLSDAGGPSGQYNEGVRLANILCSLQSVNPRPVQSALAAELASPSLQTGGASVLLGSTCSRTNDNGTARFKGLGAQRTEMHTGAGPGLVTTLPFGWETDIGVYCDWGNPSEPFGEVNTLKLQSPLMVWAVRAWKHNPIGNGVIQELVEPSDALLSYLYPSTYGTTRALAAGRGRPSDWLHPWRLPVAADATAWAPPHPIAPTLTSLPGKSLPATSHLPFASPILLHEGQVLEPSWPSALPSMPSISEGVQPLSPAPEILVEVRGASAATMSQRGSRVACSLQIEAWAAWKSGNAARLVDAGYIQVPQLVGNVTWVGIADWEPVSLKAKTDTGGTIAYGGFLQFEKYTEMLSSELSGGVWSSAVQGNPIPDATSATSQVLSLRNATRSLPYQGAMARVRFPYVGIAGVSSGASVVLGARCTWGGMHDVSRAPAASRPLLRSDVLPLQVTLDRKRMRSYLVAGFDVSQGHAVNASLDPELVEYPVVSVAHWSDIPADDLVAAGQQISGHIVPQKQVLELVPAPAAQVSISPPFDDLLRGEPDQVYRGSKITSNQAERIETYLGVVGLPQVGSWPSRLQFPAALAHRYNPVDRSPISPSYIQLVNASFSRGLHASNGNEGAAGWYTVFKGVGVSTIRRDDASSAFHRGAATYLKIEAHWINGEVFTQVMPVAQVSDLLAVVPPSTVRWSVSFPEEALRSQQSWVNVASELLHTENAVTHAGNSSAVQIETLPSADRGYALSGYTSDLIIRDVDLYSLRPAPELVVAAVFPCNVTDRWPGLIGPESKGYTPSSVSCLSEAPLTATSRQEIATRLLLRHRQISVLGQWSSLGHTTRRDCRTPRMRCSLSQISTVLSDNRAVSSAGKLVGWTNTYTTPVNLTRVAAATLSVGSLSSECHSHWGLPATGVVHSLGVAADFGTATQVDARCDWLTTGTIRSQDSNVFGPSIPENVNGAVLEIATSNLNVDWNPVLPDDLSDSMLLTCPSSDPVAVEQALKINNTLGQADRPLRVLYGDTHPVAVAVFKKGAAGSRIPILPAEASAARCTLTVDGVSDSGDSARLRGGEAAISAQPMVRNGGIGGMSVATMCLQLLADGGTNARLFVQCKLADRTVTSPPLHLQVPFLRIREFQPLASVGKPSTPQVLTPLRPAGAIGFEDELGVEMPVPSQCFVILLEDSVQSWTRPPLHDGTEDHSTVYASLLVPPANGYFPTVDLQQADPSFVRRQERFYQLGMETDERSIGGNRSLLHFANYVTYTQVAGIISRGGVVPIDRVVLQADYGVSVSLRVECMRSQGGEEVVFTAPVHMRGDVGLWFYSPPESVQSQEPFYMSVEVATVWDGMYAVDPPVRATDEVHVRCIANLLSNDTSVMLLNAEADSRAGLVEWPAIAALGRAGQEYEIDVTCFRGESIRLPGTPLRSTIRMTPCGPGKEPAGVGGVRCDDCPTGTYSLGWDGSACKSCPDELGFASCAGGEISLPPMGWFLVYNEESAPMVNSTTGEREISASAEFHECLSPAACVIDYQNRVFSCAKGHTGPLCAVCDYALNYGASSTPGECVPCYSDGANWTLVGLGVVALVLGLLYVAVLQQPDKNNRLGILFRIGMNYVTALGTLGLYKAKGTETFRLLFGWTETAGTSLFAGSPLQCAARPSFATVFLTAVAFPFVISAVAILLNLLVFALESCTGTLIRRRGFEGLMNLCRCCKGRANGKSQPYIASATGSGNSMMISSNPIFSEEGGRAGRLRFQQKLDTSTPSPLIARGQREAPNLESGGSTSQDTVGSCNAYNQGVNRSACSRMVDYFVHLRFLGTAILVVCLSYAVVSSMALSVFDCLPDAIGGKVYLKKDLRVECNTGGHIALQVGAGLVLVILGLGLPIGVAYMLRAAPTERLENDELFFEYYGFLYKGYDIARGLHWWEAIGMVRKVAIVAIGSLIKEPYNAVLFSISVSVLALVLHAQWQPFSESVFNRVETVCLVAIVITQILSVLYLRSEDNALQEERELDARADSEPARVVVGGPRMPDGALNTTSDSISSRIQALRDGTGSTDAAVTAILCLVNFVAMITLLAAMWAVKTTDK